MKDTLLLKVQHSSLQFSDNPSQQRRDIHDLFDQGQSFPIKTGTEAGPLLKGKNQNQNREFLQEFAHEFNHAIAFKYDAWVAVDRAIAKPGSIRNVSIDLVDKEHISGPAGNRGLAGLVFDHVNDGVGQVSQGCVHYATKGRRPGDPNYDVNNLMAAGCAHWMREMGHGKSLAFLDGDFNIVDSRDDWARGHNFTSMADELKDWQNTGHGPIDGFNSYDNDGRVEPFKFVVLDDKKMFQFSDHYVCRGTWEVKLLAA